MLIFVFCFLFFIFYFQLVEIDTLFNFPGVLSYHEAQRSVAKCVDKSLRNGTFIKLSVNKKGEILSCN